MSAGDIIVNAASLAGITDPPPNAALLWELCRREILNYTNRAELPEELELVGAQILADIFKTGSSALAENVQSVSEGDVSVTFASVPGGMEAWERYKPQLRQFRRFARRREGKGNGCS